MQFKRENLRPYVLTWAATGLQNDLWLHGPFTTAKDAVKYGRVWQINAGDDPSWQVVMLHIDAVDGESCRVPIDGRAISMN